MVPEEPLASTTTKVVDEVMQVEDGELKEAAIILPAEGNVSPLPDNTRKHERGVYPRPRVRVDFTYFLQEHKLKKMKPEIKKEFPNLFCPTADDDSLSTLLSFESESSINRRVRARRVDAVREKQYEEWEAFKKKYGELRKEG